MVRAGPAASGEQVYQGRASTCPVSSGSRDSVICPILSRRSGPQTVVRTLRGPAIPCTTVPTCGPENASLRAAPRAARAAITIREHQVSISMNAGATALTRQRPIVDIARRWCGAGWWSARLAYRVAPHNAKERGGAAGGDAGGPVELPDQG